MGKMIGSTIKIKDLVTPQHVVCFDSYRAGFFYYNVYNANETPTGATYQFVVPADDVAGATLNCRDKAITFMRWIRKSIADNTLVKIK